MYDQRGQEIAGPAPAPAQVEAEATEAAQSQSAEVAHPQVEALIAACRGGDLSEILRLSVMTPGGADVLLKRGTLDVGGEEVEIAELYPEGAFWPQVLARLEQGAASLGPEERLHLAQLCQSLPEEARRDVLQRVFGLPLDEIAGAEKLDAQALAALAAEAARLPGPVEEAEEEVEEEGATTENQTGMGRMPQARSLSTQATLARIGLGATRGEVAAEPTRALEEAIRHELGHELYNKQEGAASDTLREDAGWRTVSPQEFVEACEPTLEDTSEAVALLEQRFGEGRNPEVIDDKGDPDMESAWWTEVEALQDRFPNLVGALQLTRYGKQLQRKAVRGGFAHANFLSSTLSIISPELYQRLGQWSNEVAAISDKTWAAELYAAATAPGFDARKPPDWMGPAEVAYIESLKRQYPNPQ